MEVHTLADLKRFFAQPNAKIKLISAPTMPNHKWLNVERGVEKLQTNAVKLEGGSWLDWRNGARDFKFNGKTFDVLEDGEILLTYTLL